MFLAALHMTLNNISSTVAADFTKEPIRMLQVQGDQVSLEIVAVFRNL